MAELYGRIAGINKNVSRLLLGSATLSPPEKDYAYPFLDEFVELRGTAFETAHSYGDGDCDRAFARLRTQTTTTTLRPPSISQPDTQTIC
jgi:aryl-alcohol dehydrogenase-like predicted oxidoreductase